MKCSSKYCKELTDGKSKRCYKCRAYTNNYQKERRKKYCSRCGKKLDGKSKTRCDHCSAERSRISKEKAACGICSVDKCSRKAIPGGRMCNFHREYYRKYRRGKVGYSRSEMYCTSSRSIVELLDNYDAIL